MTVFNEGDLVSHEFRSTLKYIVIEANSNQVKMKRAKKLGRNQFEIDGRYARKTVIVPLNQFEFLTKISSGNSISSAQSIPQSVQKKTIEELRHNPFISINILNEFARLESDLSPENLTCDGELSRSQVSQRRKELETKWALLESYIGYKVKAEI